jgi:hypothetical protein
VIRSGASWGKIAELRKVPTEAEWGDYQADLDQDYAHKLFAGRTNQEMLPRFRRNVIETTHDLPWMPEAPFRNYMLGFRDFVMAGEFEFLGASDAASCFLDLVQEKLEKERALLWSSTQYLRSVEFAETGGDRNFRSAIGLAWTCLDNSPIAGFAYRASILESKEHVCIRPGNQLAKSLT